MANVQNSSDGNGEKRSVLKCTNSKALESIRDAVSSSFASVLSQSVNLSEEQRQRCTERFNAIYENALSQTVEVHGQLWNGRITTPGNTSSLTKNEKPFAESTDRVDYFYDNVLPKLDAAMVKVTRKRKTCPKVCLQHLQKKLKLEKESLDEIQVVVNKPTSIVPSIVEDDAALLRMASENAAEWSRCSKETQKQIVKLQQIKEIQTKLKSIIPAKSVASQEIEESEKCDVQDTFALPLKIHSCDESASNTKHRLTSREPPKSVLCKLSE